MNLPRQSPRFRPDNQTEKSKHRRGRLEKRAKAILSTFYQTSNSSKSRWKTFSNCRTRIAFSRLFGKSTLIRQQYPVSAWKLTVSG